MAKLYLKNAHEFENPARRVFLAGELFKGGSSKAKEIKNWTAEAEKTQALAKDIQGQAEEIRKGTNRELLELYVDLFNSFTIPEQGDVDSDKPGESITVKDHPEYKGKGLLEIVEKECSAMRNAFNNPSNGSDLRLLSYATVYNNFQKIFGVDANIIPFESSVITIENGIVRISFYDEKKNATVTAESELFPWDSAKTAHKKLLEMQDADRAEAARRLEEAGGPVVDLGEEDEVAPPEPMPVAVEALDDRSEYEKRLDAKVDAFRDEHDLTDNGDRIGVHFMEGTGTYNATLKEADGTLVTINVRAEVADKTDKAGLEQALEKALDEELASLAKTLNRQERKEAAEAPTDLEKDWQRAWASVQGMVAADGRLRGKVTVTEGPRNKRGEDKTIVVTNTETGESVRYMVGVKEKNNPKTYGPMEGGTEDPARVEDAKSIRITVLVMGNGTGNEKIGSRVSKYIGLEGYHIPNVEKGAYNMALIMAGIDPIEEPDSPALFDVIFKGRESTAKERPTVSPEDVEAMLGNAPARLRGHVGDFILDHPRYFTGSSTFQQLPPTNPFGQSSFTANLELKDGGSFTVRAEISAVTGAQIDAFIRKAGGQDIFDAAGVTRKQIQEYISYDLLEKAVLDELKNNERKFPVTDPAPLEGSSTLEVNVDFEKKAKEAAKALNLPTLLSAEQIRGNIEGYHRQRGKDLTTLVRKYQDGDFSYLEASAISLPDPKEDGSCEWSVNFKTVDGTSFEVRSVVGAVNTEQVKAYVEAQAALGNTYSEAEIIQYLGLREIIQAFQLKLAETEGEMGLAQKYRAYLLANRPETSEGTSEQRASAAAEALELPMRLSPEQIEDGLSSYQGAREAMVSRYGKAYLGNEAKPFLKETYRRVNDVNPDGSALWHTEYEKPNGNKVIVRVETPAIEAAQVDAYIRARADQGMTYDKDTLSKYLGYIQMMEAYEAEWRKQDLTLEEEFEQYRQELTRETTAPIINLDEDEETDIDLRLRNNPSVLPGMPEGDYRNIDWTDFTLEDSVEGKIIVDWENGVVFQGEFKNNLPNGLGALRLENRVVLGPTEFKDGNAVIELPEGHRKEITWSADRSIFEVHDR